MRATDRFNLRGVRISSRDASRSTLNANFRCKMARVSIFYALDYKRRALDVVSVEVLNTLQPPGEETDASRAWD